MSNGSKSRPPAKEPRRANRVLAPTDPNAFSLEGYMADENTRVFNFNGRRLVSILGREHFPGERTCKLPTKVIEYANRQPLTAALLPCRIGYFPRASGQKVSRPQGDWAFTLLYCLDGAGVLNLSHGKFRLTRGTVALLRPFEFHAYEAEEQEPWSYYWIHFNGTMAQQYYEVLTSGGDKTCIQLQSDPRFIESFDKIINIFDEGHAYRMLVQASALMHQLLGGLYGAICSGVAPQETSATRIERTLAMMRNNVGMQVSIHELAAVANMSHAYFALQFRRHTGQSPRSFFNQLKIAKACEYLQKTHTKVETIAHLVGYDDPFYFCRLFKRVMGQTPTTYRQTSRGARAASEPKDEGTAAG